MSPTNTEPIENIKRCLNHEHLETLPKNMYKVKKGHHLPVTAKKVVPNPYFGYTIHNMQCNLPENSVFICHNLECTQIDSDAGPIDIVTTATDTCYGGECSNMDWDNQLFRYNGIFPNPKHVRTFGLNLS